MRAAALLALAGCGGATGTITLGLVSTDGSIDRVARARLTLSDPPTVVENAVGPDHHIDLALDVLAEGRGGDLTFEGFDAASVRVAYGRTPSLPVAAVDATVNIYVAAPGSMAAAAVMLDPPRTAIGSAAFPFGVVVAGGTDAAGATTDALAVYDVYTHGWRAGLPLPAPRAAPTIGASTGGYAYVFGGRDAAGAATGTLWRFDTTVAPMGELAILDDDPALARADAAIAQVGGETFLVAGTPPAVIDGISRSVIAATTIPSLVGTATSIVSGDALYALFIGDGNGATGVVRVASTGTTEESVAPPADAHRTGHGAVPTTDGRVLVIGGAVGGVPVADAIDARPAERNYLAVANVLATPRVDAAIASSGAYVVVAGGTDAGGVVLGDAEILDGHTLAHVATLPLVVPRTGAVARPLANGQVLVIGGVDAAGAPIATIELFTPDPP